MLNKINKTLVHKILLICLITSSSLYIYTTFPTINEYKVGADEGTYYKQAKTVLTHGLSGFKILAESFVQNANEHVFPNPLRIGHTITSALFLKIQDSITMLTLKSWIYYILILLCTWWYTKKIWDFDSYFYIVILLSVSPLLSAMSKRALIDIESLFFIVLALYQFIYSIKRPSNTNYYLFIAILTLSCFFKETAFFLIPFYILFLLSLKLKNKGVSYFKILMCCLVPPIVVSIVYFIVLKDFSILIEIIKALYKTNSPYMDKYGSGPWFQYLIDFLLLSPFVSLFGLFYIGFSIITKEKKTENLILLFLALYLIIIYSLIAKNVRFLLLMEILLCIFAGFFIVTVYKNFEGRKTLKETALYLGLVFLIYNGFKSYNKYFVKYNIYDPIGYNLLYAAQIVPNTNISNNKITDLERSNIFLNESLTYYKKGNFFACIEAAKKSIEIVPNSAAFNNICAAYNQLKEFDKGIEACKEAIKLDSTNKLAEGNLSYAISQTKSN